MLAGRKLNCFVGIRMVERRMITNGIRVMCGRAYSRRRRARDIRRAAGGAQAAVTTPHAEVVLGSG